VRRRLSTAFFVYVALDADGRPSGVPPLALSGAEALAAWTQAERRREMRLARR
jgi:acyl-CoA hydrolase